jgi:predicted DNA-binding transcriptional regulator AlpA
MASTDDDGDGVWSGLEPLLLPRDVAARLRVSEKTLTDWRSLGIGPKFLRLGRTIRYRAADVEAYLDQCAANDVGKAEAELKPPFKVKKRLKKKDSGRSGSRGIGTGEDRSRPKKKGQKRRT